MTAMPFRWRDADDALARRVARGDQAACTALFERYHRRLELYCHAITRNEADAEDAAQSALAKAFAALQARAPQGALRPWLFRIAHNEAVSLMRRRRPESELAPGLASPERGPGEVAELQEEVRAVLADVRELPPRAQQALLLRELADLEYAAVAEVLGISPGGARQAVFEARLALQADRAGRETPCEGIRRELSDHDGARRPTRQARGHLRGCSACRSWRQAQAQRRRAFGLLPGLPLAGGLWASGIGGSTAGVAGTGSGGIAAKVAVGIAAVAAGTTPVAVEHERDAAGERAAPSTVAAASAPRVTSRAAAPPRRARAAAGVRAPVRGLGVAAATSLPAAGSRTAVPAVPHTAGEAGEAGPADAGRSRTANAPDRRQEHADAGGSRERGTGTPAPRHVAGGLRPEADPRGEAPAGAAGADAAGTWAGVPAETPAPQHDGDWAGAGTTAPARPTHPPASATTAVAPAPADPPADPPAPTA